MAGTGTGSSSGSASFNTSFSDINTGLFGESAAQSGTTKREETTTEKFKVDEKGILSMIENILSGTEGLAQIFGQENAAGIFSGSQSKAETENLLAKIAGEIAKVTTEKTTTRKGIDESSATSESEGIVDKLGDYNVLAKPGKKLTNSVKKRLKF